MFGTLTSRVRRLGVGTLIAGIAASGVVTTVGAATPAAAEGGKRCVAFAVDFNGKTFRGDVRKTIKDAKATGKTMFVHGTMAQFTVNLDTFEVTNYLLTAKSDVTGGKDTTIFTSKAPQLSSKLTGPVSLRLQSEQLILSRGTGANMKIQAKDCSTGGMFQMEAEPGQTYVHQLAAGFHYFEDNLGRTLFTNGTVIGRESPELATLVSRTDTQSTWAVQSGGRMGGVFGEDAIEA
jgi:hypothetical protein